MSSNYHQIKSLRLKQHNAILGVAELLGIKPEKIDDQLSGEIMNALEKTSDDHGNYYPQVAHELLKQHNAILEVAKILNIKPENIDDQLSGEIMNALEKTSDDHGNYYPQKAHKLLKQNKNYSSRTRKKITTAISNGKKIAVATYDNDLSEETMKAIYDDLQEEIIKEKFELESGLPEHLNGANVEIIERDGHCLFRSIAHQLREYGFEVPGGYQQIRNLIAVYIDNNKNILKDTIDVETDHQYKTVEAYTNKIRRELWGGRLEIQAVHDGCLNSLTDSQALKIIVYSVGQHKNIGLDPNFLHTMPNGEEEKLINRWPIRVLYVNNNHFHRIYFDDPNIQKINYDIENRNIDIDLMSKRPTTAQLKDMGLLESSHKNELRMSPRDNELRMSKSKMEEQIKALSKMTNKKDTVKVDENSVKYDILLFKNMFDDPFMIMGYQNGQSNLLYETVCTEVHFGKKNYQDKIYRCKIFIPREADINDRKFTRYPNPTMLNVDGKTIVNISLHKWANIWDDDNNRPLGQTNTEMTSGHKSLNIYMFNTVGVEEVKGTEGADFTSISLEEKPILYMRHGVNGLSYSPDTGVIALDDKKDNPYCAIHVTDPSDGREMVLMINFYRKEEDFLEEPKLGGKSRRKTRKHRRRRTMRKSFRRKK